MRLNEPLRAYLEKRLGMPVQLVVGADYAATGEALRFGRLDIAYLGPVTYILRSRSAKLEPFARPSHAVVGPTFTAVVIVPADSRAESLADLKGGEVAFGDPASTSGTWVPRYQLLRAGLVSGRDYTLRVLGAHDAVALAVANHRVAAGGLSQPIYARLLREGKINPKAVRVLEQSPPIPEYMWTFRQGLDPAFKEEVREAFIHVRRSGGTEGVQRRGVHSGGRFRRRPGARLDRGDSGRQSRRGSAAAMSAGAISGGLDAILADGRRRLYRGLIGWAR